MPTAWSTGAPTVSRPAPSAWLARPSDPARIRVTNPDRGAVNSARSGASVRRPGSSTMRGSPPWHSTRRANVASARPDASASSARAAAAVSSDAPPPSTIIRAASRVTIAVRSAGPPPRSVSRHSTISTALPMHAPSGASMSVMNASVRTPARVPIPTIARARARAPSRSWMNAPSPHLTSSTSASLPSAIFLLMIDEATRGMLSTVAVTSRNA